METITKIPLSRVSQQNTHEYIQWHWQGQNYKFVLSIEAETTVSLSLQTTAQYCTHCTPLHTSHCSQLRSTANHCTLLHSIAHHCNQLHTTALNCKPLHTTIHRMFSQYIATALLLLGKSVIHVDNVNYFVGTGCAKSHFTSLKMNHAKTQKDRNVWLIAFVPEQ